MINPNTMQEHSLSVPLILHTFPIHYNNIILFVEIAGFRNQGFDVNSKDDNR